MIYLLVKFDNFDQNVKVVILAVLATQATQVLGKIQGSPNQDFIFASEDPLELAAGVATVPQDVPRELPVVVRP